MKSHERKGIGRKILSFLPLLCLSISVPLFAKPKNIIIIRHAEKVPKNYHLSLKGLERAEALAYYFSETPLYNHPPISHIFAAGVKKENPSIRPIQTCTPIANHYNLPLNTTFKNYETNELAKEILTNPKYNNSSILICWSHGHIRPLALALGADNPEKWHKDIFDQAYMLTYQGTTKPKMQIILQQLMYGDRSKL